MHYIFLSLNLPVLKHLKHIDNNSKCSLNVKDGNVAKRRRIDFESIEEEEEEEETDITF